MPIMDSIPTASFEDIVKKFAVKPNVHHKHPNLELYGQIPSGRQLDVPPGNRVYVRINEVTLLGHFDPIFQKNEVMLCAMTLDSNSEDPIKFHTPNTFTGIKKGDKLPLGDKGLGVYAQMPAKFPEYVMLNFLLIEDDTSTRSAGEAISKLRELEAYKTLLAALKDLLKVGPVDFGKIVDIANSVVGLVGHLLEVNKNDQITYMAATYTLAFDNLGVGPHSITQAKAASVKYEILTTTAPPET